MDKVDSVWEQMVHISRDENPRKEPKLMLEIKKNKNKKHSNRNEKCLWWAN